MIVDHRTYAVKPGSLPAFLKIYQEQGWPVQKKHLGKCLGWYVSMDIGPLNQVVHLWGYVSLEDRAARRAALMADADWQAYLGQSMSLLDHMENKILSPAPFYDPAAD